MERPIDLVFVIFFFLEIPIITLLDSQVVCPRWIYPTQALDFLDWYTHTFRDPLIAGAPGWFAGLFLLETFIQLPLILVMLKVFWQGVSKFKWIRIPAIIYASHMCTMCFAILYHIFLHDFLDTSLPAPRTSWERVKLSFWYIPFFTVPFMLLIDASCSSVYKEKQKRS